MALSVWGDHWSCGSEKSCKTPKATMKFLKILCFLGFFLQDTTAVTHSLKYFYTGSSGVPNFPEFVSVGFVDDVQMNYFDSDTQKAVPKQDWMIRVTEKDPEYWQRSTWKLKRHQQSFRVNTEILKQHFNQSGGVHIFQSMYGCEWDDETKGISGYRQFGFDGEDLLALDLKTMTWITPKQQAVITKQKWDNDRADLASVKNYLTKECIDWLKKYLNFGRSSLMRKDRPSVSLLQKSPSSPITCHATGFYPNSAVLFWRKDGEELHEDVEHGEILPNHDGSFQMSVELLKLPSEDWGKYECVFQLSGVKEDMVTKLEKPVIRTNHEDNMSLIIGIVIGVLLAALVVAAAALGFKFCRGKKSNCDNCDSENSSELNEKLNQEQKS